MDRLTGQAALSQLLSHQKTDKEVQLLAHILSGEGGSKVSEADAKVIAEMILMRQNNPRRIEAFSMTFGNPLDLKAPAAELWTAQDFRNAALAAGIVKTHVFKRLQRLAQWLNGIRAEDDLEPWT